MKHQLQEFEYPAQKFEQNIMARFNYFKVFITIIVAPAFAQGQDDYTNNYGEYAEYQDYNNDYQQEDNLYYDYAEREQQKK